jgi:hypothetical protein
MWIYVDLTGLFDQQFRVAENLLQVNASHMFPSLWGVGSSPVLWGYLAWLKWMIFSQMGMMWIIILAGS